MNKKRICLFIVLCALATGSGFYAALFGQGKETAEDHVNKAEAAEEDSLKAAEKELEPQANNPDAYIRLFLFEESKNQAKALNAINKNIANGENSAKAYILAGDLTLTQNWTKYTATKFDLPAANGQENKNVKWWAAALEIYRKGLEVADPKDKGLSALKERIDAFTHTFSINHNIEKPNPDALQIFNHPMPRYTEEAQKNKVQGTIIVGAIFGANGKVTPIVVFRGLPDGLNASALKAVSAIKFKPAMRDGKPISQFKLISVQFQQL